MELAQLDQESIENSENFIIKFNFLKSKPKFPSLVKSIVRNTFKGSTFQIAIKILTIPSFFFYSIALNDQSYHMLGNEILL